MKDLGGYFFGAMAAAVLLFHASVGVRIDDDVSESTATATEEMRRQSKLTVEGKSASAVGQQTDLLRKYLSGIFDISYTCKYPMRLGKANDGGYVVCEDVKIGGDHDGSCQLFSYGISGDDSLETAFHERYGCGVEEFDPTVSSSPGSNKYPEAIRFHQEGISEEGPVYVKGLGKDSKARKQNENREFKLDTLQHHHDKYAQQGKAIMLKIDVEEFEWESLKSVSETFFDSVDQFLLELHIGVTKKPKEVAKNFASNVVLIETLRKHFYLHHTHLVNCCKTCSVTLPGVGKAPKAVELSFIRKSLVTGAHGPQTSAQGDKPLMDGHPELDQPCNASRPLLTRADFE